MLWLLNNLAYSTNMIFHHQNLDLGLTRLLSSLFLPYPEAAKANDIQTQEITISIICMAELTSQKAVCIILIFGYYILVI